MSTTASFLFDTNIISELSKKRPAPSVLAFVASMPERSAYISVLTLGELRRGAKRNPHRNLELTSLTDAIERKFRARTLPVTSDIARLWGEFELVRTLPAVDSLLAATALVHNLTLVTRNTRDVADTGVKLFNPWLS